ncbi:MULTISPECIES: hypothetical protein [unclassified Microbulbifer]|uniref:hypothetical protein n=1 Tax=unclassified Microbulbifer TaxID=2619833 RepID=UPI0027E48C10|nr:MULTISPECIES: hypothetical protein [unclassified Microbulbifer]
MFLARGAKNVALFKTSEPKEIVTLTVPYEYIGDKAAEELKMAWIGEQEEYCSKEPARFKSWCEAELLELKSSLNNHNEWRYRLTEKALTDSFQKLSAQKVIFKDTSHLDYTTTYKFTPHEYNANQVFFYSIECPAKLRKQKEAICTLILNQAFYSENPSEYFYIEKTSDVETAIWAYAAHKDIPVIPANDWMERWLEHPHRVSTVEIDDDIAKFSYHSGGCWHQVWYRIVGNNEKLEFIKTTGGFCV